MPESDARSPKQGMSLWLVLITLMGGAFLFQRGRNQPEDKPSPAAVADHERTPTSAATPDDRMLEPLRAFLGIGQPPVPADGPHATELLKLDRPLPGGSRLKASAQWVGKTPSDNSAKSRAELEDRIGKHVGLLEFLVVTVADPIDTATNLRFDLQLDALHKALGTDSYVLDRYYLPWESPQKGLHRTEPGVLLYRRNGASQSKQATAGTLTDLLMVYLVGETPTSGIHKAAFLSAVRQIRSLEPLARGAMPGSQSTIHVGGLLFTGAADSLALAIHQAHENDPLVQFRVITGGAISVDRSRFTQLAGPGLLEFHAAVLSGRVLREGLIEHVRERAPWKNKVRIAWLTETGTGYGSSSSIGRRDENDKKDGQRETATPAAPLVSSPQGKTTVAAEDGARVEIIEFTFPVNISKVRAGYAESRRRERSGQLTLGPESSRLPIPFEDTNTARDMPPMQTPKVTAPTAELILGQILTAIRNQGIRYVGISSSDPRDPIFLAELIHEQCPGAQLMLVSSDVLYTHSEYRSIMHGTLVASPYPLHPQAYALCFPFGEHSKRNSRSTVLGSPSNYGLYNAVLFLRGLARGRFRYDCQSGTGGQPDVSALSVEAGATPSAWPLGYSMPLEKDVAGSVLRPPIWISRISSAGIYPITVRESDVIEPSDDEDTRAWKKEAIPYTLGLKIPEEWSHSADLPQRRVPSRVPPSLYIANIVWLVLAALYCAAPWIPRPVGTWAEPLIACRTEEFHGLMFIFRALITGSFLYVLTMFGGLSYVLYLWLDEQGIADYGPPLIQLSLCAVVGLALCGYLLHDVVRAGWGLARDVWRATASLRRRMAAWPWDRFLDAVRRIVARRKPERAAPNAPTPAAAAPSAGNSWSRHLIVARSIGLMVLLGLAIAHISSSQFQRSEWQHVHPEDAFLWFMLTSDMWNGLSPAMTAQLLATSLILLAFGIIDQMHMFREHTVVAPDAQGPARRTREEIAIQEEKVRRELVFPLINRLDRGAPVVLYGLFVAATLLWLFFVFWQMQIPDHFVRPLNFPIMLLFFVGGFWCVRLCKLVLILNDLKRQLEDMTSALKERWPDEWPKAFALLSERPVGLHELFWSRQPKRDDDELARAQEDLKSREPLREIRRDDAGLRMAEQRLRAVEIYRYVRQAFRHVVRLGLGLAVSACLLFLTTQNFPFSREPLLRLSASIMLASVGCVVAWYYLKFDRNELLSHLVGTDPKRISLNWSLVQMIAPAVLLTAVALVSQAFPEIWQWLRSVLEPMARSSI